MAFEMVILDTCILIEIQRGNRTIIDEVYQFSQDKIFLTPVVIAEFYRGARNKSEFEKCCKLVAKFGVLSLDDKVIKVFTNFFIEYALSHRPSIPDMLIAATSLHYNIPLFTINKRDFGFIAGLQLV